MLQIQSPADREPMLRHFLQISLRHLNSHKAYSLINAVGLSLGLAACFVIVVYCRFQTSFDHYNEHLDNICLVTQERPSLGWVQPWSPLPMAAAIKAEIPEVEETARWMRIMSTIRHKEKKFSETLFAYSDPEIFKILTLPFVHGDLNSIRLRNDYLVISESMARKYFGDADPIGETVIATCWGETYSLTVAAVMKDIPATSTFRADAIGPLYVAERFSAKNWRRPVAEIALSWDIQSVTTYTLLHDGAGIETASRKVLDLSLRHQDSSNVILYHLYPLREVYLHAATMVNNVFPTGNITNIYIYASSALLLLCIACVNYLLLNLGRASLRTREIGIRKVFGARRSDLFGQLIVEATVLALLALPIAVLLVEMSLQYLSMLLGARIATSYFHSWQFILAFVLIALIVGAIAGSYVSMYLARLNPVDTLRNRSSLGTGKVLLRRALMMTQMIIFIGLTFASITIYKQLMFFQEGDMGFVSSDVMILYPESDDFGKNFEAFRSELKSVPGVQSVSAGNILPGSASRAVMKFPRKDNPAQLATVEGMDVDREFVETFGMRMTAGESFLQMNADRRAHSCIINETAVRELGLSNPIGEQIGGSTIAGVVHDFNLHSFRERIPAVMMTTKLEYVNEVAVKIAPRDLSGTIGSIEEISKKFNEGKPIEWQTFSQRLDDVYTQERRFARVIGYAAGVAILVGCLGILGMSMFVCQQRVKEIGIRKVLGASVGNVYVMVTKEFVLLVVVSAAVAYPITRYAVGVWLQRFAYQAGTNVWDILAGILIDVIVVLFTISVQAMRAATSNPVKSLRYE